MTFDEAIEQMEELQGSAGYATYGVPEANNFSGYDVHEYLNAANEIINNLRKEYAPTTEMTEGQFKTILDPKEGKSILGLLGGNTQYFDYLFWEPLTEKQIVQAWLHPETIKVIGENNDTATSGRNKD